ncbi:MAG: class I SAM-dependent methyltransferase [Armatimonadetes bacterium]|nr:class I SAM-dependent methyltransferase [Armatimonadota bacterium]
METEEKLFADMATPKPDTAVKWRLAKSFLRSLVSRLVETSHPRLVLYAGCGMDDLSEVVCGPDTKLLNADIVFAAVDRERGPGAYGVCCDLRRPPFARDSFDLILAVDVLHHFAVDGLDEPIGMLAAALKPGGMMLIMEPNVYYLYRLPIVWMPHRLRNLLRKMKRVVTGSRSGPAPHEAPMAPSAIVSILWRHSLSDIETVSCPIYFPGAVGSLLAGFLRRFPKIGNKLAYHFCFLATKAK